MQVSEAPASRPLDALVAQTIGMVAYAGQGLPRYSAPQSDTDRAELLGVLLWLMRHPRVTILAEAGYTTLDGPHIWKTMGLDTTDLAAFALCVSRAAVLVSGVEEIEEQWQRSA